MLIDFMKWFQQDNTFKFGWFFYDGDQKLYEKVVLDGYTAGCRELWKIHIDWNVIILFTKWNNRKMAGFLKSSDQIYDIISLFTNVSNYFSVTWRNNMWNIECRDCTTLIKDVKCLSVDCYSIFSIFQSLTKKGALNCFWN